MAQGRLVNTNFWKDLYISDLDPIEKLLFLYLFTNPQTSLAGVYQLNIREVAFDTGIDRDMVVKILAKFCADGKMHYERDWLVLRNFIKHQRPNPSIKQGIQKAIAELPQWLQDRLNELHFGAQISLELVDKPQSDASLGTSSPQKKLIEAKLKEANITKPKTDGFGKITDQKLRKSYAKAVEADRRLEGKEKMAKNRSGGSMSGVDIGSILTGES